MRPFILTRKELDQNDYPVAVGKTQLQVDKEEAINQNLLDEPVRPQEVSLKDAMAFVLNYHTTIDTLDIQMQLPPYVMAPSAPFNQQRERQIFAMDAEMVETEQGRELARITLVRLKQPLLSRSQDQQVTGLCDSDVVFDVLVRPRNAVINYWTQYSGVTAAMLHDNETTVVRLEQVQAALLRTIHPHDIVVGHSLENDLRATRFLHGTVVDTAVLFGNRQNNSARGSKFSLRHLAAVLLNLRIQQSDQPHCSEQDAVTALQLAVRRAWEGPTFGIHPPSAPTNWLAQLSSSQSSTSQTPTPNTVVAVGPAVWLQRHVLSATSPNAVHALQCDSVHDDGPARALESWLTGPRRRALVVWTSLGLRASSAATEQPLHEPDVHKLEERLTSLLPKLPPEAILLLAIQPGYSAANKKTQLRQVRRHNPKATLGAWTDAEEEEWRRLVQSCRMGSVLWVSSKK